MSPFFCNFFTEGKQQKLFPFQRAEQEDQQKIEERANDDRQKQWEILPDKPQKEEISPSCRETAAQAA